MQQYRMEELIFSGAEPSGSQAQVDLAVTFTFGEREVTVKGFYAGNGVYKARFLPLEAGEYRWRASGCICAEGVLTAEPAPEGVHGPVRAEGTRFVFADGTAYHPFGTTVYALVHQDEALIDRTMASLKQSPFNKVRLCVFPKHYDYNHNEPAHYPFERDEQGRWDVHRPCFAYWDALEARLGQLSAMGIQADLILFHPYDRWGFDAMPQQDNLVYLDYLLRRLSAMPDVWWSLANEYDLSGKTLKQWEQIEQFVADGDPFGHMLSCHNCFRFWDFSQPNVTHASIQSKLPHKLDLWRRKYGKPVVLDECGYEGNLRHFWGSLSGQEMTSRFWMAAAAGAYCTHGETFLDEENQIVWWSRGGELKGESAPRIAFLRNIIESLPGHLEGMPTFLEPFVVPHEAREAAIARMPHLKDFIGAFCRMDEEEQREFMASEFTHQGHIGETCFLWYYVQRCCAEDVLRLPEGKKYRVEVIDAWNMTRRTVAKGVCGEVRIELPGRPYIAVLAQAEE